MPTCFRPNAANPFQAGPNPGQTGPKKYDVNIRVAFFALDEGLGGKGLESLAGFLGYVMAIRWIIIKGIFQIKKTTGTESPRIMQRIVSTPQWKL